MKIILSRKGFDSSNGGYASPIMPDGRLLSLPIPVMANGEDGISYADLMFDGQPLSETINQLSNGRFNYPQAHLDPDLDRERYPNRQEDWRPVFGQIGNAQSHLVNQGVGEGALFLFFGRFQRTEYANGELNYVRPKKGGKELHVIFGWLQVGKTIDVATDDIPDWLQYHLHVVNFSAGVKGYMNNNMIYVATDQLTLGSKDFGVRGGGTFPCFKPSLQLTAPGRSMRHWRMPKWFYPFDSFGQPQRTPLSYHSNPNRWTPQNNHVILKTTSPGQEFVLDTEYYPEAIEWLKGLFEDCC
jgi:hypothetical protein